MSELKLQQSQRAQLSLQQILSSQLLQLPLQRLEQRIYQELQENPMLELVEETKEAQVADDPGSDTVDDGQDEGEMFDVLERFNKDREGVLHFTMDNAPREHFVQAVQRDSVEEDMLREFSLLEEITPEELLIAAEILGNLDNDGYFLEEPEVVMAGVEREHDVEVSLGDVERVRQRLVTMDPPGVAACNLQERLLVQLAKKASAASGQPEKLAGRVLRDYFDDFVNNRFDRISKKLDLESEELEPVIRVIAGLDRHPFVVSGGDERYILPDFIVTYDDGRLTASLNDRSNMTVQVTGQYSEVLKNRSIPREDRQFMRQKLNRAREFTSAIEQRRHTLIKVIETLMAFQYRFFVSGPAHLVPLGMKDVAEKSGFDLSTISRAVNGKYVQTRFGTFELKYFFSGGMTTDGGDELSTRIIKGYLKEIIEKENARKPLSDGQIAEMIEAKGVQIARRTVAKYREQMQIPVARLRKKIF